MIDTSAIIAVIIGEPERVAIISATSGKELIGPGSIPWEVGNAFTAMMKRDRIEVDQVWKALDIFKRIQLRYVRVDMKNVVSISHRFDTYAYDAYFLDCSVRHNVPLLTLDLTMKSVAKQLGIEILNI